MIVFFLLILFMVNNNYKYENNLKKKIVSNTDIKEIKYINEYDGYYVVCDNKNIYLYSDEYQLILKLELDMIHENKNNYDIIYREEQLVYFKDEYVDNKLIYKYYDLYTYEELDKSVVGG